MRPRAPPGTGQTTAHTPTGVTSSKPRRGSDRGHSCPWAQPVPNPTPPHPRAFCHTAPFTESLADRCELPLHRTSVLLLTWQAARRSSSEPPVSTLQGSGGSASPRPLLLCTQPCLCHQGPHLVPRRVPVQGRQHVHRSRMGTGVSSVRAQLLRDGADSPQTPVYTRSPHWSRTGGTSGSVCCVHCRFVQSGKV